jgi:hypothetical protein
MTLSGAVASLVRAKARATYFRTSAFLVSSVSTNCTGISTDLIPRDRPYPVVHRLAVPVHERFLGATGLLAHWLVDRVTDAQLVGFRRPCAALMRSPVYCCVGHFSLLPRLPSGGVSSSAEAAGKSRLPRWLPTALWPTLFTGTWSGALGIVGVLGQRVDDHHAKRDDHHR